MKNKLYNTLPIAIVLGFVLILSCGDDDGPGDGDNRTPQQVATDSLTQGAWTLANGGSILFDNNDVSDQYTGFSATFNFNESGANNYTTLNSGGPSGQNQLFNASGTWEWANGTTNNLINLVGETDKGSLTVTELTTNRFAFRFQQLSDRGTANGVDGLAGNYTITLTR